MGDRAPDFCFARDRWSQIINLQYGPDGQMWMIDWYDENACHHRKPDDPRPLERPHFQGLVPERAAVRTVDLKRLSDDELVDLQLNENDWYVRHARRILQERGTGPVVQEKLAKIASSHPHETRRLRALWALFATGGLTEATALAFLQNDYPHVRAWTTAIAHR